MAKLKLGATHGKSERDKVLAAKRAADNHRNMAKNHAEAVLANPKSTFAERNHAQMTLKTIKKGKPLK